MNPDTPPTPHAPRAQRITESCRPVFPCEMKSIYPSDPWHRFNIDPGFTVSSLMGFGWNEWRPLPTPPTERPAANPPHPFDLIHAKREVPNALPAEVREASTPLTTQTMIEATESVTANAALLRLFKGEYRNAGDRHNDSLYVRERLQLLEEQAQAKERELTEAHKHIAGANAANGLLAEELQRVRAQLTALQSVPSKPIRTIDHPEANGRKAKIGEQAYTLSFTNEAGAPITVEMGRAGFNTTTNLLMDMLSNAAPHDDGSTTTHPYWKLKAQNESLHLRNQVLELALATFNTPPSPSALRAAEDNLTAVISRVIRSLGIRGDEYLSAVKAIRELILVRHLGAAGRDGDTARQRLDYIHEIMCEKSNNNRDLELGSTAYKSVIRWADWRGHPMQASLDSAMEGKP